MGGTEDEIEYEAAAEEETAGEDEIEYEAAVEEEAAAELVDTPHLLLTVPLAALAPPSATSATAVTCSSLNTPAPTSTSSVYTEAVAFQYRRMTCRL